MMGVIELGGKLRNGWTPHNGETHCTTIWSMQSQVPGSLAKVVFEGSLRSDGWELLYVLFLFQFLDHCH
jgi:hypothetical protein